MSEEVTLSCYVISVYNYPNLERIFSYYEEASSYYGGLVIACRFSRIIRFCFNWDILNL